MQIECPECSKMISDKADFCPHCGYSLKKAKDEKATGIGCLAFIVIAVVVYYAMGFGNSTSNTPQKARQPDDISAFVMSQSFVEDRLVSPSTAKFPYITDAKVTKLVSTPE